MVEALVKVLTDLQPLQAENKNKTTEVLNKLLADGEESKIASGWKFELVKKRKSVPFNEKLVLEGMKRFNKNSSHPIPEEFLDGLKDLRKKKQSKNPEVVTLRKSKIKTKDS